jgi:hypothetical protein
MNRRDAVKRNNRIIKLSKKLKQKQIAEVMNIPVQTVSRILVENGIYQKEKKVIKRDRATAVKEVEPYLVAITCIMITITGLIILTLTLIDRI